MAKCHLQDFTGVKNNLLEPYQFLVSRSQKKAVWLRETNQFYGRLYCKQQCPVKIRLVGSNTQEHELSQMLFCFFTYITSTFKLYYLCNDPLLTLSLVCNSSCNYN